MFFMGLVSGFCLTVLLELLFLFFVVSRIDKTNKR